MNKKWSYQRFLPGLRISETMVLPHDQAIKGGVLDGTLKLIARDGEIYHIFKKSIKID